MTKQPQTVGPIDSGKMQSGYTPGPWEKHWHDKWIIGDSQKFNQIAEVSLNSKISSREMDNNAALIAAAPELLESLKMANSYIAINAGKERVYPIFGQDAITKAQGQ